MEHSRGSYIPPPNEIVPPPKKGLDYEALWEISKEKGRSKAYYKNDKENAEVYVLEEFLERVLPRPGEWLDAVRFLRR